MQVTGYHQIFNDEGELRGFERVAVVTVNHTDDEHEALEYAWRYTNNVVGSWSLKIGGDANDDVEVVASREDGLGLRSSMIGDRFYVKYGEAYEVAMCGFDVLPVMEDV